MDCTVFSSAGELVNTPNVWFSVEAFSRVKCKARFVDGALSPQPRRYYFGFSGKMFLFGMVFMGLLAAGPQEAVNCNGSGSTSANSGNHSPRGSRSSSGSGG